MLSLQDYSLVNTCVLKIKEENEFNSMADAFYLLAIGKIIDLQDDEIIDCITDNAFLKGQGESGGHDRGIDAIYIDYDKETPTIHFFNCKYTENYSHAKNNNFPSNEIDKINTYLIALMHEDIQTIADSNSTLQEKTQEIWDVFKKYNPHFVLHICSNYSNGMEPREQGRLERIIASYSNFSLKFHTISNYVESISGEKRVVANVKFRANGKEMFEKSDGDIRALIVNIRADELMRMITSNEALRDNVDLEDYSILTSQQILEDTFYDNVRIYQKQRSRINKAIIITAESDERNRFFYYNNGITITCKSFNYPKIAQPVITLEAIQIVNGSQTLHALFEVAKKDYKLLKDIDILCRIYELKNPLQSSKIAEYTNSQNPVTTRDIRSIDYIQQKLEMEFELIGYYYERKKNQYENITKKKKIDAEKAGQSLMAYYNRLPAEAKNEKRLVFGDKYDVVFNDAINSNKLLLAYELYCDIEREKGVIRKEISTDKSKYELKSYILYSSYYILFILSLIAEKKGIENKYENKRNIMSYYKIATLLIEKAIHQEKKSGKDNYSNADFFKSARPKIYIEDYLRRMGGDITDEKIAKLKMISINIGK